MVCYVYESRRHLGVPLNEPSGRRIHRSCGCESGFAACCFLWVVRNCFHFCPLAIVPLSVGFSHAFCYRLLLLVHIFVRSFVCFCFALAEVCFVYVFDSDVKDDSVGVAIDEPSGGKQIAPSQIVFVIPVSSAFRMEVFCCVICFFVVALVSWGPLSCFYHHLLWYVDVCFLVAAS